MEAVRPTDLLRAARALHVEREYLRAEILAGVLFLRIESRALADVLSAAAAPDIVGHLEPDDAVLLPSANAVEARPPVSSAVAN